MRLSARHQALLGVVLVVLLVLSWILIAAGRGEAHGSVLSRGPNGWLAARRYLEARGAATSLLDAPLDQFKGRGALVSAFPWQHSLSLQAADQLEEHLRRGGDVVLAYSGERTNAAETVALEGLGLSLEEKRKAVLSPLAWRRFAREEWDLLPAPGLRTAAVRVWAPRWLPEIPRDAQVLFRSPRGEPVIVVLKRLRGRLWLLPADALANARLENPGNADLLETLLHRLGRQWTFDEYHHGLVMRREAETAPFGRSLDLILLHLGILYLAAVLTLARRFGPAWSEPPVVTGSAGSFLLGLGEVHHRLGHHREAARRLLDRVQELDRTFVPAPAVVHRAETAGPGELVALAREVARLRERRPPAAEAEGTERETAA